jgi:ring-1,2-phenylacetyl-CoA epoxidase subunit PaaA/ring-1,2-phenylacetyl-CoA epoxidase subunit PaaC
MSEFKTLAELDEPCQRALYGLLLILADSKHILGLRYAEWISAPQIEASIAAVSMAQDELGHARLLYSLVEPFHQELGWPERPEEPNAYRNMEALDHEFASWAEFVAVNALLDSALFIQLDALKRSSYLPLRGRLPKILEEERYHFQHGTGWFLRLAAWIKTREELESCVQALWPQLVRWLGDPQSEALKVLHAAEILAATPDDLRAHFLGHVGPLLARAQFELPLSQDEATGRWILTERPSWQAWDESFRRMGRRGPDDATWGQIIVPEARVYPVG